MVQRGEARVMARAFIFFARVAQAHDHFNGCIHNGKRERDEKQTLPAIRGASGCILHPFRGAINRSVRQPGIYPAAFFF